MNKEIVAYNHAQGKEWQGICNELAKQIGDGLPKAESKIWHRTAVWFLDENPIVGYSVRKKGVQLLFWSGQSFDEPNLIPSGSFKASEAYFTDKKEIDAKDLRRWLKKGAKIQWDYKNIVKRRGKLERLK